ncbi:MAG TPA: peptidoglycan DD-metalloendopeptidase family protein [Paraburkholderia sp.]|jgi:lipoprotein NlpD|nr:peptidoglycan DD-metalloendopeptidase family protein [Paraburkholderia sp.]
MNRQRRRLYGYAALAAAAWLASACTMTPWEGMGTQQPYSTAGVPAGYYRVNPGDTLARIAAAYGQHPQDIAAWNQLPPNAAVVPGQVLRVAPPAGVSAPPPPAIAAPVPTPQVTPGAPAAAGVAAPVPVPSISLEWPVRGPIVQRFVPGQSTGIVIGGSPGEQVKAAAAGRVVYAGTGIEAYGPLVIIKHNDSIVTAYGHNSRLLVTEDQAVAAGQPIAEMGTDSRGVAGVQFEVRADGKPVDPLTLLPH